MPTIQILADLMASKMQQKSRNNGDVFYCLESDSPQWMTDACFVAHGDFMPDDWRYNMIRDALISIQDADSDDDADALRDCITELADSDTDVYNGKLLNWLASNLQRPGYVDDAIEEFGFDPKAGILKAIQIGQMKEREEVYGQLIDALEAQTELMAEPTGMMEG